MVDQMLDIAVRGPIKSGTESTVMRGSGSDYLRRPNDRRSTRPAPTNLDVR